MNKTINTVLSILLAMPLFAMAKGGMVPGKARPMDKPAEAPVSIFNQNKAPAFQTSFVEVGECGAACGTTAKQHLTQETASQVIRNANQVILSSGEGTPTARVMEGVIKNLPVLGGTLANNGLGMTETNATSTAFLIAATQSKNWGDAEAQANIVPVLKQVIANPNSPKAREVRENCK